MHVSSHPWDDCKRRPSSGTSDASKNRGTPSTEPGCCTPTLLRIACAKEDNEFDATCPCVTSENDAIALPGALEIPCPMSVAAAAILPCTRMETTKTQNSHRLEFLGVMSSAYPKSAAALMYMSKRRSKLRKVLCTIVKPNNSCSSRHRTLSRTRAADRRPTGSHTANNPKLAPGELYGRAPKWRCYSTLKTARGAHAHPRV